MQHYFSATSFSLTTTFDLPEETYRHIATVMRMQAGDQVELVHPDQRCYVVELDEVGPQRVTGHVVREVTRPVELPVEVTITCGVPKQNKAEWIVQKGTELGATHFIFCDSQYAVAKWQSSKRARKVERLQKIARGAAEQSHRLVIPTVEYVSGIAAVTTQKYMVQLVAYEEEAKQGEVTRLEQQVHALMPGDTVNVVIGPEGGLAPAEVIVLQRAGYTAVGLGPRILRAETAPLYVLAALSYATELTSETRMGVLEDK
ncbi:16S rRNA (uracil(1498)-N(3))-methyltransferase [Ligilactobacillus sp. LYQ139]|uniref:16S rRNA (uracil(1498)-N(3))-methyltransferase n=1 Tax=Ligilactobacillus sp. LYQ139 TaxID=3378800 RepID=UPI00385196EA